MDMISIVSHAVREELGVFLDDLACQCKVIQRKRKVTGSLLLQTLILTLLQKPNARPADLYRTATLLGLEISQTALDKRWKVGQPLVDFLKQALEHALQRVVAAAPDHAALFQNFEAVFVGDSSTIALPEEWTELFPGRGGTKDAPKAALKLHVLWDLKSGRIEQFHITEDLVPDVKSPIASPEIASPHTLWIFDLGYFETDRFAALEQQQAKYVSRIQYGTKVCEPDLKPEDLLHLLKRQPPGVVDMLIFLGAVAHLSCRLIAVRVPEEVANRRRQNAKKIAVERGRQLTEAYSELLGWSVFITNVDAEELTWKGVVIAYRVRWQIELLFKLWKSHNAVATRRSTDSALCQLAWLYARLLAVLLQHWLLLGLVWRIPGRSLAKAASILRDWMMVLIREFKSHETFVEALREMSTIIEKLAKVKRKKKKPTQAQLIENEESLEWMS